MKWGREIDYHGSRAYGSDVPDLSPTRLLLDWLMRIASGKLGARREKPAPRLSETTFTLLGVSSSVSRRTTADPFPRAPGKNDNGRVGLSHLRNEN
jgi:hypothetical protein